MRRIPKYEFLKVGENEMEAYIVRNKSLETVYSSQSGGAFTAISDYVLDQNGVVYGVILEDNKKALHMRAATKQERDLMRKSKYIQSHVDDIYCSVEKDLAENKLVLFTGTPCQIVGLTAYLKNKKYENLILVDLICHGVPSEIIWQDLLRLQERKHHMPVQTAVFRDKSKHGWKGHIETYTFEDGTEVESTQFKKMFYSHEIVRPSCFQCKYKNLDRRSDLTIGDAWGYETTDSPLNDGNGTSMVLVNSECGARVFKEIEENILFQKCDIHDYLQPPLKEQWKKPSDREKFWRTYNKKGITGAVKYYNRSKRIRSLIRKTIGESLLYDADINMPRSLTERYDNIPQDKDKNALPVLAENKVKCSGCYACAAVCSKMGHNAISMVRDNEGFYYPKIDLNQCVGCKSCERVCQYRESQKEK